MNATDTRLSQITERLAKGYRRLGAFLAVTLAVVLAAAGISLTVVLPLWLLATRYPAAYSAIIGAAATGSVLYLLFRSIRSDRARRFSVAAVRGGFILSAGALAYAVAALVATGRLLIGIPLGVFVLIAIGLFYGSPRK
ncbi:MAG: hypothetical protein ACLFM0_07265 [Spirochaetales bacterium]